MRGESGTRGKEKKERRQRVGGKKKSERKPNIRGSNKNACKGEPIEWQGETEKLQMRWRREKEKMQVTSLKDQETEEEEREIGSSHDVLIKTAG